MSAQTGGLVASGDDLDHGPDFVERIARSARRVAAATLPRRDAPTAIARGDHRARRRRRCCALSPPFRAVGSARARSQFLRRPHLDGTLAEARAPDRARIARSAAKASARPMAIRAKAGEIVANFAASLPQVRALLDTDVRAGFDGDPSAASIDEIIFSFPGVAAVLRHRIAHRLYCFGAPMLARIVAEDAHSRTGIDIHPGAEIGERFFIDHGTGVVIGETAIIGRNVRHLPGGHPGRRSGSKPTKRPAACARLPAPSDRRRRRRHLRRRDASRPHRHRQGIDDRRQRLAHPQRSARQPGDAGQSPPRDVHRRRRNLNCAVIAIRISGRGVRRNKRKIELQRGK